MKGRAIMWLSVYLVAFLACLAFGETEEEKTTRLRNEQIARLKEWRQAYMDSLQKIKQARQDSIEAAREALQALRSPPARVWRIGRTVFWEPPKTADQVKPECYWVSEEYKGSWTYHGDCVYQGNEARLFGDGPARVETKYPQQALGEVYYSPIVEEANRGERFLVSRVRFYASETEKGERHVNRWRRVLAAFGVTEDRVGWAGRPPVSPLNPPMKASEAMVYADFGWSRWQNIPQVLRRLEADK